MLWLRSKAGDLLVQHPGLKHTLHACDPAHSTCLAHVALHKHTTLHTVDHKHSRQTLCAVDHTLHLPWARLALSDLPVLRLTDVMVMV